MKATYSQLQAQLSELRAERDERAFELDELNREIVQLEEIEQRIRPFVEPDETASVAVSLSSETIGHGLSFSCSEILAQSAPQFRTARGIRDSLEEAGYPLKEMHNNPLASIHGILKRFVEAGTVEAVESNGKMRYRWIGPTRGGLSQFRTTTGFSGVSTVPTRESVRNKLQDLKGKKESPVLDVFSGSGTVPMPTRKKKE